MSTTPTRSIPTMKGIFPERRATPSRNFLIENILSLRLLEKSTSEKLAAKEPVRPNWMPALCLDGSKIRISKASRPPASASRKYNQESSLTSNRNSSRPHQSLRGPMPESGLEDRNPSDEAQKGSVQSPDIHLEYSDASCGTQSSSTSIGIQTEDITDEFYLANALKRCSFNGGSILFNRYDDSKGSRNQLRPTRYLLKAKREKAAPQAADARDPGCPRGHGHGLLTEQDRVGHLNNAQKRYDGLIRELNHMPMSSHTLRVRSRKEEIDKELAILDEGIRVYRRE